jgi:hypothetical protein
MNYKLFSVGQKSLADFTNQLKIVSCQENVKVILFYGYVRGVFLTAARYH